MQERLWYVVPGDPRRSFILTYERRIQFQRRSEDAAEIYAEKSRVNQEQVLLTEHKAHTFKQEMDRLRETAIKTEREKIDLEKKMRDTEYFVTVLSEEKDKKAAEADKLKQELLYARSSEREATQKLLGFLSRSVHHSQSGDSTIGSHSIAESTTTLDLDLTSYELSGGDDLEEEIEKER